MPERASVCARVYVCPRIRVTVCTCVRSSACRSCVRVHEYPSRPAHHSTAPPHTKAVVYDHAHMTGYRSRPMGRTKIAFPSAATAVPERPGNQSLIRHRNPVRTGMVARRPPPTIPPSHHPTDPPTHRLTIILQQMNSRLLC